MSQVLQFFKLEYQFAYQINELVYSYLNLWGGRQEKPCLHLLFLQNKN